MNSKNLIDFMYIVGCVGFTVIGQLLFKWRMGFLGKSTESLWDKAIFLLKAFITDPLIILAYLCGFVASLFWMLALTKFELSFAYPFMSLSYLLVLFLAVLLFKEGLTWYKVVGLLLVIGGLFISSRSS